MKSAEGHGTFKACRYPSWKRKILIGTMLKLNCHQYSCHQRKDSLVSIGISASVYIHNAQTESIHYKYAAAGLGVDGLQPGGASLLQRGGSTSMLQ